MKIDPLSTTEFSRLNVLISMKCMVYVGLHRFIYLTL